MKLLLVLECLMGIALGLAAGAIVAAMTTPTPAGPIPDDDPFCFLIPPPGLSVKFAVTGIVDGDTLDGEVKIPVRVRLLDCWAAENNTAEGKASTRNLKRLAIGKAGTLWVPFGEAKNAGGVFSFDRVLGHVKLYGAEKTLSEMQVESGHATTEKQR